MTHLWILAMLSLGTCAGSSRRSTIPSEAGQAAPRQETSGGDRGHADDPRPIALPLLEDPPYDSSTEARVTDLASMRLSADGHPFAVWSAVGETQIRIQLGADGSAVQEIDDARIRMRGRVNPAEVVLFPTRPAVLDDMFVLGPRSRLHVVSLSPDGIAVRAELPWEIEIDHDGPRQVFPYSALQAGPDGFTRSDADELVGKNDGWVQVPSRTPLSARAGEDAALRINLATEVERVGRVVTRDRGWLRVHVWVAEVGVLGWSPTRGLPAIVPMGPAFLLDDGPRAVGEPIAPGTRCDDDLPIVAHVENEDLRTVGHVHGGITFETLGHRGAYTAIRVSSVLEPPSGASWLVRATDLETCTAVGGLLAGLALDE